MSLAHNFRIRSFVIVLLLVGILLLAGLPILAKDLKMELLFTKTEAVTILQHLADKFNEGNPDVYIEVNAPPDARFTVIPTRLATGNAPEILSHYPPTPDYRLLSNEGYLLDLTDQSFMENVEPEFVEKAALNGRNYALPLSLNSVGIFYNTKMFAEHGWDIPKTYAEFLELCETIETAGITPLVFTDLDAWSSQHEFFLLMGIEVGADANYYFADVKSGKASVADHPGYVRAAEKLLEIRKHGIPGSLGIDYTTGIANFAHENVAMYRQGIWAIPSIREANPNLEFSMFPFPADKEEDTKVMVGIDLALCLPAEGYLPEALEFLAFMTQKENAEYYAQKDGSFSLIKDVHTRAPEIELMGEYIDAGRSFIWPKHLEGWSPNAPEEFATLVQELITFGNMDHFLQGSDQAIREGQ